MPGKSKDGMGLAQYTHFIFWHWHLGSKTLNEEIYFQKVTRVNHDC